MTVNYTSMEIESENEGCVVRVEKRPGSVWRRPSSDLSTAPASFAREKIMTIAISDVRIEPPEKDEEEAEKLFLQLRRSHDPAMMAYMYVRDAVQRSRRIERAPTYIVKSFRYCRTVNVSP